MPGENPRLSAVLTDSFHMNGALGSSNIEKVLSERGERSDHCARSFICFVVLMLSRVSTLSLPH